MKWFNWQCRSPLQVILTIHPYYHPLHSRLACPIKFTQFFSPWILKVRHVSKGGICNYKVCLFSFSFCFTSPSLFCTHNSLFTFGAKTGDTSSTIIFLMSLHHDQCHVLHTIDRNLRFFTAEEQQHLSHFGLLKQKERHQLGKLIKETHRRIQKILALQQSQRHVAFAAFSTEAAPPTTQQQTTLNGFFQHKQTKQLYWRLKAIKDHYHGMMLQQQIRILENDMERYQQLQIINGLSGRLDASSHVSDELHYLRLALSSLHHQWKLDRIQDMVNTLAITTSPPSSMYSPHTSSMLLPLSSPSSPSTNEVSNRSDYRHNTLTGKDKKSSFNGILYSLKRWLKHPSSPRTISRKEMALTATPVSMTATPDEATPRIIQGHHHQLHQRSQPHSHLLCSSQEECEAKVIQIVQDFHDIFEENAHQNEQRMHQIYPRAFEPGTDSLLAEDIQRFCASVTTAPPQSLASLTQPDVSSALARNFDTRSDLDSSSNGVGPTSFSPRTIYERLSLASLIAPPSPSVTTDSSAQEFRQGNVKWIKRVWHKNMDQLKRRQVDQANNSPGHHQQQVWSICLGLLSEHLLHVGQQYYAKWLQDLAASQDRQTALYRAATETLASMYRALQIEQGHAVLSNLCTHLESSIL